LFYWLVIEDWFLLVLLTKPPSPSTRAAIQFLRLSHQMPATVDSGEKTRTNSLSQTKSLPPEYVSFLLHVNVKTFSTFFEYIQPNNSKGEVLHDMDVGSSSDLWGRRKQPVTAVTWETR
jgi:hypothetical protein